MKPVVMFKEIEALESALATLQGLIQSIVFRDEVAANQVISRLHRSKKQLDGIIAEIRGVDWGEE